MKPGGTGDGSAWAQAKDLAAALNTATTGDELWVATGTYTPTVPAAADPRSATFTLTDSVAIYGGFAGLITETLATRDWATNVVTLSGDIGIVGAATDNSYHVVTGATGATLDGVTISGGNANGTTPNYSGGGMYNSSSSPTLTNVTISGNTASNNGGGGGGMYNNNSSPTLTNVTISGNTASVHGGGVYNTNSSPTLTNVTISGNTANNYGGGVYNTNSSPTLTNVTFSGNSAYRAGGMSNDTNSSPTLTNVTISGNSAADSGGGMVNLGSSPTLINVTISGNSASTSGGGSGGGMYNDNTSKPQIRNSIIWGNTLGNGTANNIANVNSTPVFSYTLLQGSANGWGSFGTDGGNNLDSDPKFVTPIVATSAPTTTGEYRLQVTSPAINMGDNAVITTTTDLDGNPRIIDLTVDMGAYEVQIPTVQSITRADLNPTNAATVTFTVTFNVNVSGVNDTDFTLTKTDGQNGASTRIASVSSSLTPTTTWTVTVSTTDLVTGTIRLDVVDDDSIINAATPLVPLGRSGTDNGNFSSGEVYTVDRRAPTVTLTSSASDPTNVSPIPVTVTFSEAVTGFIATDVLTGNATLSNFTPVSGSVYTFTLTPQAEGVVTATVDANVATNAAGNGNSAATTFSITYARSSNADLSNLILSGGTLSPSFATNTTSYTVAVSNTVISVTVTPTVSDTNATVTVNGTPLASGHVSDGITLTVGLNLITVRVTAQDGTTKSYIIAVTRAGTAAIAVTQTYTPTVLITTSNAITLTIVISSTGPDAVTGVVVTDNFPPAVSGTPWTWTCVGTGGALCGTASGTGNLKLTLGLLPKDGSFTFIVTGTLLNPRNWSNMFTVVTPTGVINTTTGNQSTLVGRTRMYLPLVAPPLP